MQLSEMEEEMDQRIQATERKTREQVGPIPSPHDTHVRPSTADPWLCVFTLFAFFRLVAMMRFFPWSLCRQSDKQGAFVQLFPHVKQTYAAV